MSVLFLHGGRPPVVAIDAMIPGSGWSGAISQPAAVGDPGDWGYDTYAIANWTIPPFQTVNAGETIYIGVAAFKAPTEAQYAAGIKNAIDYVEVSAMEGPWIRVSAMTVQPALGTSKPLYVFELAAANFPTDGLQELRAKVVPLTGLPLVLQGSTAYKPSMWVATNKNGSLPSTTIYVDGGAGNDTTGTGSNAAPVATINKALDLIKAAQSNDVGGGVIKLKEYASYAYGIGGLQPAYNAASRHVTIMGAEGTNPDNVIISTANGDCGTPGCRGIRVPKVHLRNLTTKIGLSSSTAVAGYVWFDSVKYLGPGRVAAPDDPMIGINGGQWTGAYITGCEISETNTSAIGARLVLGTHIHDVKGDPFSFCQTVIDCEVSDLIPVASGHPDIWQAVAGTYSNVILYGVKANFHVVSRQIAGGESGSIINGFALVDYTGDNRDPGGIADWRGFESYSVSLSWINAFFWNVTDQTDVGSTLESNFVPTNFRIVDSTFNVCPGWDHSKLTAATKANPIVLTQVNHQHEAGDVITISGVTGMTQLNGNSYKVVTSGYTANTYSLTDLSDVPIDSTSFGTYGSLTGSPPGNGVTTFARSLPRGYDYLGGSC